MSRYKPYPACKDSRVEWLGDVPEREDLKDIDADLAAVMGEIQRMIGEMMG